MTIIGKSLWPPICFGPFHNSLPFVGFLFFFQVSFSWLALWSRTTKNRDVSYRPCACLLAHLFAPLTNSFTGSVTLSLSSLWESELSMLGQVVLNHSALYVSLLAFFLSFFYSFFYFLFFSFLPSLVLLYLETIDLCQELSSSADSSVIQTGTPS